MVVIRLSMGCIESNKEGDSVRIIVLPTTAAAPKTQRNILSSTMATMPQS